MITIRLPIVLSLMTGLMTEPDIWPYNDEFTAIFRFFLGRPLAFVLVPGHSHAFRADIKRVRELMIQQHPALANVTLPDNFSKETLSAWLLEQEQRLGGKVLVFHSVP